MLKVWQDKKPSETSKKALDSVGVERGHGSGRLQEQASMIRSKIYEVISFQLVDNQYIDICPVSYFQGFFGKFQNSTGQYRPPSSLHTGPQKVCPSPPPLPTKGKKSIEKQVKPQPSPSALSLKQKWETPHAWRWLLHSFHSAAMLSEPLLTTAQS